MMSHRLGHFVIFALLSILQLSASAAVLGRPGRRFSAAVRAASDGPVAPPDSDPFYRAPAGFEKLAPGTILRNRTIQANFFNMSDPVSSWQLLYRTTAVDGSAIAAVTTIFKPAHAILDRFVSFATAYDASATKCDPSYYYRLGSGANPSDHGVAEEEFLIIEGYLLQGYIVASPDYEGPDAAFTPGHLEGQCVLDNMRAVLKFGPAVGFSVLKPSIVGVGYSGGAIATGWAASLQPSYAPELPIKGWAQGGTPANLTGTLLNINGGAYAGYIPPAVAGLASTTAYYKQLNPLLSTVLTAKGKAAFQYAKTHCQGDDLGQYAGLNILSYDYQTVGPAILQQPALAAVLQENIMGLKTSETPKAPVLVYHSLKDEIIPYANASSLVDRWCGRGVNLIFNTFQSGSHVNTAIAGIPNVYAFVAAAFAGTVPPGCNRATLPNIIDALSFGADLAQKLAPILPRLLSFLDH